ncbi:MFS transporter [Quadrisphaera sp. KR29]|uniref:MFS transporter n=1 Tax=Quadrisphaera sp. KR29 TaxID=3461391 RepID=UPI0040439F78
MSTADPAAPVPPRLDLRHGTQRVFAHLLASSAVVSVINYTVWFAITFWVFLETRSVFATGMIAGIFVVATAATGIWFGSLVDNHRKRAVMQASALVSAAVYAVCLALYLLTPAEAFRDVGSWQLWAFIVLLMLGVIAGNPRAIALPTLVTLLVPEDRRDRANGLVGTVSGTSMLVTSVISGVLVASGGMLHVLLLALVVLAASVVHLARVDVPEPAPGAPLPPGERAGADDGADDGDGVGAGEGPASAVGPSGGAGGAGGVDLRGTWRLVRGVPGLVPLIAFSCFNNFIGGGFMALMDAYGLSLVSVQVWGLLWGGLSALMIVGGLLVARLGLGTRPVRLLLLVNVAAWTATMLFPLVASVVSLAVAMAVFMLLMPFAEAAEQTVLQRVVPYERQGRVFGFAQSVEQAAAPVTAFLVGPLTQFVVVPLMSGDGAGARAIGGWFGTGQARAIALVFVVIGAMGLVATLLALASPQYRRLSASYAAAQGLPGVGPGADAAPGAPVGTSVGLAAGLPAELPVGVPAGAPGADGPEVPARPRP